MAHLCGLCLTLRDLRGQNARFVTNYDGLLVSVLTEAQSPAAGAGIAAKRWQSAGERQVICSTPSRTWQPTGRRVQGFRRCQRAAIAATAPGERFGET
jgi:hypothetical protein